MEIAYVLVQCKLAHEMEVLKKLLDIEFVKEAKGTFGYYDILVKIVAEDTKIIEKLTILQGHLENLRILSGSQRTQTAGQKLPEDASV